MKKTFLTLLAAAALMPAMAQRVTDKLDRGLIAQKATSGMYLSWRILADEYYDVKYNVYRDGTKVNEEPLDVSNFTDKSGTTSSKYTVTAVVRGKEQAQSKPAAIWNNSYMEIKPKHDASIKSVLVPNDACCADVDGDGEVEILMKYDNADEIGQSFPKNGPKINGVDTKEYSIFECLKLDGTVLWWVNCGPNMGDFQNNEQNIVGYDWNMDGKAEVVMRLEEGSTIHYADGTTYTIGADGKNGTSWTNYRQATGGGTNWFMCVGKEFLVYCNGETGKVYDIINYPLARLEAGETDLNAAWGDGYGHRASKFFFGAPYLDGKHPSIFLARGIYTQIKMCAFDVNTTTNKLVKRWDWRQTSGGYWMWQGYHNYGIADVDMDGRDEIVYGSMVIDDNGKGLSTTGLGHGDAQHCGDFNPYIHGLEIYACNEDQPGNNYRDATTSKIYHRFESGNDDGRAMMDNFSDSYPGAIGCSAREGAISSVTNGAIDGMDATGINTNFRIYWDGDLCSETFNYRNGKNTEGVVAKYGSWSPIYTCAGSMTNNDTKGTPCYQGDILGDWREEIIMRTAANNIRIYSTPTPTTYRNYSLWYDHQYRNAMVWQMCGYNQPPHVSYFLGKLEGITMAPPPLTMTGREEVKNGGTVSSALNDKHVIVCESGNSTVAIENGVKPHVLTFNVPSWVQGTAGTNYTAKDANIKYEYYTCNVTGGALAGEARLVKQGDGKLILPNVEMTHTGATDIWEGVVNFDGKMKNSPLWLNRFTELNTNGGEFLSIKADYASVIRPGGADNIGNLTADSIHLDFGSRVVIDIDGATKSNDVVKARALKTTKKTGTAWVKGGPEYLQPVIEFKTKNLVAGDYVIAEVEKLDGSLTNIKVEGIEGFRTALKHENGKLILTLGDTRGASEVVWTGVKGSTWNFANTENFALIDDMEATPESFINGDLVEFNDNAKSFTVNITENLSVDTMKFVGEKNYTLSGTGSVIAGALVKEGTGTLTISNTNAYTGGNYIKGGTVAVKSLANDVDANGALGAVTTSTTKFIIENGAELKTTAAVKNGSFIRFNGEQGGVINNSADFTQQKALYGTLLTKKGAGNLITSVVNSNLTRLVVTAGTLTTNGNAAKTVELQGGALVDNLGTTNTINIPKSKTATWRPANRQTYTNILTGEGKVTIYSASEKGSNYYATRTPLRLNLSKYEGTITAQAVYTADGRFTLDTSNGSNTWTLDIPSGIIVQNSGKTLAIGKLTGSGTLGGSCTFSNGSSVGVNTWNVGNDDNCTFSGVVTAGDIFNKVGAGTMTVSGVWTNTGKVTIKEGTMKVNNKAVLGTGALDVAAGATLQGSSISASTGAIKNSSVNVKGTLLPNMLGNGASGILVFNNQNVTVGTTGEMRFGVSKASTSESIMSGCYISNIGKLTVNGTISIFFASTYTPQAGDEIRIFKNVASVEGNPIVVAEPLDDGTTVELDASRLSEGVLVVKSVVASSINNVPADEQLAVVAYDMNGVETATFTTTLSSIDNEMRQQGMPSGTYVLRIKSREGMFTMKKAVK